MRKSKVLVSLITLVIAGSAVAAPDAKAPAPVASMKSGGSEFGYFVGTWKCKESWSKSPFGDAYESTSTLIATNDTDGVWIAWSYVQDPTPKNPHPPKGNDLWGYDPAKKEFVRMKFDNYAPGVVTTLKSKGFVGGTISWDGPVQTPKGSVPFKHTFTKVDDKTIDGRLYMGGKAFYQSTCTKS